MIISMPLGSPDAMRAEPPLDPPMDSDIEHIKDELFDRLRKLPIIEIDALLSAAVRTDPRTSRALAAVEFDLDLALCRIVDRICESDVIEEFLS